MALAAKADGSALVLFIDEVQYLASADLSALIVATHKLGRRALPFLLIGAGLPQLAGLAGDAKSYAERLFDYPSVGPLLSPAARDAIAAPLKRESHSIDDKAPEHIIKQTQGYPYFLQEWGYQAWNAAAGSPITLADLKLAAKAAVERLDAGFFKVRIDRLTPRERESTCTRWPPSARAPSSLGRHRSESQEEGVCSGPAPRRPHQEGHDLQPTAR